METIHFHMEITYFHILLLHFHTEISHFHILLVHFHTEMSHCNMEISHFHILLSYFHTEMQQKKPEKNEIKNTKMPFGNAVGYIRTTSIYIT
jgi:hypothetical protein